MAKSNKVKAKSGTTKEIDFKKLHKIKPPSFKVKEKGPDYSGMAPLTPERLMSIQQKKNPNQESVLSEAMQNMLMMSKVVHKRKLQSLSPSMFPICSIKLWIEEYRGLTLGSYIKEEGVSLSYYGKVGTLTHELFQDNMGKLGDIWGDWNCTNYKCELSKKTKPIWKDGKIFKEGTPSRRNSTNNKCPECGSDCAYKEKKILYKGIVGFIDGLHPYPPSTKDGFWVSDFKTTSTKKVDKDSFPEDKHLYQLPIYCRIMELKGRKVYGFSLLYIPRDNPNTFYEHRENWTDEWREWADAVIKLEKEKFESVHDSLETTKLNRVIACKPCMTEKEYRAKMHGFDECPMLSVCFDKKELKSTMKRWAKVHDTDNIDCDAPFTKILPIFTQVEYMAMKKKSTNKVRRSKL